MLSAEFYTVCIEKTGEVLHRGQSDADPVIKSYPLCSFLILYKRQRRRYSTQCSSENGRYSI